MRSAISLFNPMVGRKSVSRFWPLWGTYLLIWLLLLPGSLSAGNLYQEEHMASRCDMIAIGFTGLPTSLMTAGAAILAAMAVWSYLMNPRATTFYHALPVRREGLFITQYLTGFGFLAIPAVFTALVSWLTELGRSYSGGGKYILQWLAVTLLLSFFFFSLASFCAFLTGHLAALPILYILFNFAVVVVEYLLRYALGLFLNGVQVGEARLTALSPLMQLEKYSANYGDTTAFFNGFGYLGWLALAAAVLAVFSLLLYRRRHSESSGDVIAVPFLRPVFKYVFALGCAVVLGSVFYALLSDETSKAFYSVCLLVGGAIGYLCAEMLLKKRFRVLHGSWKGLCALLAVVLALSLSVACDLFGVERWTPDPKDVKSVTVCGNAFSDADTVARVVSLHRMLLSTGAEENEDAYNDRNINIQYTMKNGRIVARDYQVYGNAGDNADIRTPLGLCTAILDTPDAILARSLPPKTAQLQYITVDYYDKDGVHLSSTVSTPDYEALFAAAQADAVQGTLNNWDNSTNNAEWVASIRMEWYYRNDMTTSETSFDLYLDDTNIMNFLQNYGYLEKLT